MDVGALATWWDATARMPRMVRVTSESGDGHVLIRLAGGRVERVPKSELDRVETGPRKSGQLVMEGVHDG